MIRASAARPLLWPLVPVYRLGLALREKQLRLGFKPVRKLQWPVVSIGNLSTGGAGKTPLTIALARALAARGVQVDVLSRGYGRRGKNAVRVDANGSAADFGDEPLVIAREAAVPVYVAAERFAAGTLSERASGQFAESARLREGVHLLDDGFQHRQLARAIDILLLSSADLTDVLLPAGNLRETLHAPERAHVIAIRADDTEIEAEIRLRGWRAKIWRVQRVMEVPKLAGPVVAFCGIARPGQFFEGLERQGATVAAKVTFPDHYRYSADDLERIVFTARAAGATTLLTTGKDRVRLAELVEKLPAALPLKTATLRVEIENEAAAIDWLIDQVNGRR